MEIRTAIRVYRCGIEDRVLKKIREQPTGMFGGVDCTVGVPNRPPPTSSHTPSLTSTHAYLSIFSCTTS